MSFSEEDLERWARRETDAIEGSAAYERGMLVSRLLRERREARTRVRELEAGIQAVLHDKDGIDHSECTIALDKLAALLDGATASVCVAPDVVTLQREAWDNGARAELLRVVAWLRTTPQACGVQLSITSSQDIARLADDLESGAWRGAPPTGSEPPRPALAPLQCPHVPWGHRKCDECLASEKRSKGR